LALEDGGEKRSFSAIDQGRLLERPVVDAVEEQFGPNSERDNRELLS
jgi:hypothetical protein